MLGRSTAVGVLSIAQSLAVALAVAIPTSLQVGAAPANAAEVVRQNGDLFVGAAKTLDGSSMSGGIWRVRGTAATLFCSSPDAGDDPGWWSAPNTLIVDSRGRIVFLAPIGFQNMGLLRCDQPGQPAERLGALHLRPSIPTGWPDPYPAMRYGVRMGSLHVLAERMISDDLRGMPKVTNEDSYEFVVQLQSSPGDPTAPGPTEMLRYGADSGTWQSGHDLPDILQSGNLVSVVAHGRELWSANGSTLRRTTLPLKVELSGTAGGLDYRLTYTPFGGMQQVTGAISDDTNTPNVSSGCNTDPPGKHDDITDAMPYINGFVPFPSQNLMYDEHGGLGLVVNTTYGLMPGPYLTHVASALLNDDPMDDVTGYFHQPFMGCAHVPWIQYDSILPWTSPGSTVAFDNVTDVIASAPGGMVGTSFWGNSVLRLTPGVKASTIVALLHPGGIAAYPAIVPSMGTVVYITVHSPVDVLLTDATGKRIGADAVTGVAINDFGAGGFDSGPGEPRVFAIKDPAPGAFTLSSIGTGSGPYRIDIASADLATAATSRVTTTGTAAPGVAGHHDFTVASGGAVSLTRAAIPPSITPHLTGAQGANGWYTGDVSVAWDVVDGGSAVTASAGCGPTAVVADTAGLTLSCTATNAAGTASASVTVKRDATAPAITGARTAAGPGGWNTGDVAVTFACTDATSGVASCPSPVTVSSEGAGQAVTATATDRAGNTKAGTVGGINIDKTAPVTTATRTPPATTTWDRGDVSVALLARDVVSGVATTEFALDGGPWTTYTAPLAITSEGAHTVRYRSRDVAGNLETAQAISVNIDRTPPEAVVRLDPVLGDLVVIGTDAGSGVAAGPIAPSATLVGRDAHLERRTYRIADAAGNLLALTIDVKRAGHELEATIVGLRYNGGPERLVGAPRYAAEWRLNAQGVVTRLEQEATVGLAPRREELSAQFDARTGLTRIEIEAADKETKVTRAGLALLLLTTDRGSVGVTY